MNESIRQPLPNFDFSTGKIKAKLIPKSRPAMLDMDEAQLKQCARKFRRFAAHWNIKPSGPALKMFLACALDTAMHKADCDEVSNVEWEWFYHKVKVFIEI